MTISKHIIFGFVGASGSGKTTLMIELLNYFPHLSIIKSTSTRPRRDESDDLFYKFVPEEYITDPAQESNFLSKKLFSGNHYVYEKQVLDAVLATRCGMFAILEHTVPIIRSHGYNVKLIKVIPDRDWQLDRSLHREKADTERENNHNLTFDLTIENSFKAGGLENSVQQVAKFITETIPLHLSKA